MPVANFDEAFRESTDLADRILGAMNSGPLAASSIRLHGDGGFAVPRHHRYSVGIYARARSYFSSVLVLVKRRLADEALTLGRSLFEDSLRLDILANLSTETDRVDAIMNWVLDGLNREAGLLRKSDLTGATPSQIEAVPDALAALEDQRKNVVAYRERHGSGRRRDFFNHQRLESRAKETERHGSWWMHEVGHQMVHGGHFAHRLRQEELDDNVVVIDVSLDHPEALLSVTSYAAESAVVSHHSICSLVGIDLDEEFDRWMGRIEELERWVNDSETTDQKP